MTLFQGFFDAFHGFLFMGFSGSLSGLCPIPRRKGEPPAPPREGRLRRKPISTPDSRANLHHDGQPPFQEGMGTTDSKKEGQEGRANHHCTKKKQLRERSANSPSREGRTDTNKEGSTITPEEEQPPRRKGRPPHQKDRTNSHPEKDEKEKPNSTLPKRESQRNAPRRKGATPTKACQPSHPRPHCLAISCVTPDLKIENLKLAPDRITPQIENANVAIQIAIAVAIKLQSQLQPKLHLRHQIAITILNCTCVCVFDLWSDVVL